VPVAQRVADNAVLHRVSQGVAALAAESDRATVSFAQVVAHGVAVGYWRAAVARAGAHATNFPAVSWKGDGLRTETLQRLSDLGADLALLSVEDAMAEVGRIYSRLLPAAHRKLHGIYYTPLALTQRLVDDATRAGMDWLHGKAISPSCGGGAFMIEDARRMVAAMGDAEPAIIIASVGARLMGWDLDPFACWLSQLAVEAVLLPHMVAARRRLAPVTQCRDSLMRELGDHKGRYDLANDNPPFGKVKDTAAMRAKYARSLRGHPNSYGMFTDLCIHLVKPAGGIVALLTPTSWLAGNYFGALRRTLAGEARPASIALVESRKGTFDDVLQEVSLSCFVRGRLQDRAECSVVHVEGNSIRREATGVLVLPADAEEPWFLPRHAGDRDLVAGMRELPWRLRDYGYSVSTGPLVWNRAAKLGRTHAKATSGCVPICWSEAVSQGGRFMGFAPRKRDHAPYYQPRPGRDPNVVTRGCILVQRTTAKEQHRRLISALLPQKDLDEAGGRVAVENHLNMVLPTSARPAVPVETLAAFLATDTADRVLRCINASVAVSATELEALPLPAPGDLVAAMASANPESAVRRLYGINDADGENRPTQASTRRVAKQLAFPSACR
jgi:adenine-specific DNA-methyltransferase